jgi:hypothetical protein
MKALCREFLKFDLKLLVFCFFYFLIPFFGFFYFVFDFFVGFDLSLMGGALSLIMSVVSLFALRLMVFYREGVFFVKTFSDNKNINIFWGMYFFICLFYFKFIFYILNLYVGDVEYRYLYIAPSVSDLRYSCDHMIKVKEDPSLYFSIVSICVNEEKFNHYFRNEGVHILTNKVRVEIVNSFLATEYRL